MSYPTGIRLSSAVRSKVVETYASGLSLRATAAVTGVSMLTVYRLCKHILRSKSVALTGRVRSAEHRKNLSRALLGHKVSAETRRNQSIAQKRIGTVPPSQKGRIPWNFRGATPEHERIRKSAEYSEWRRSVYRRDNHTCRNCGARGVKLHAHHIKSFSAHADLRLVVSNGLTLCEKCHKLPGLHAGVLKYRLNRKQAQ